MNLAKAAHMLRLWSEACSTTGRYIATLDAVNPFPALLGCPVGGGMIFVQKDYLISKEHHLSDEEMFRQIDCVLVPKLQVTYEVRQLLTDVYGPYLQANFVKTGETGLWTVLSAKADKSKAEN